MTPFRWPPGVPTPPQNLAGCVLGGGRAGRRRGPTHQEEVGAVRQVCERQAGRLQHLRVAAALAWEVDARETEVQVLTVWGWRGAEGARWPLPLVFRARSHI